MVCHRNTSISATGNYINVMIDALSGDIRHVAKIRLGRTKPKYVERILFDFRRNRHWKRIRIAKSVRSSSFRIITEHSSDRLERDERPSTSHNTNVEKITTTFSIFFRRENDRICKHVPLFSTSKNICIKKNIDAIAHFEFKIDHLSNVRNTYRRK